MFLILTRPALKALLALNVHHCLLWAREPLTPADICAVFQLRLEF